jgi:hypothetical protein
VPRGWHPRPDGKVPEDQNFAQGAQLRGVKLVRVASIAEAAASEPALGEGPDLAGGGRPGRSHASCTWLWAPLAHKQTGRDVLAPARCLDTTGSVPTLPSVKHRAEGPSRALDLGQWALLDATCPSSFLPLLC